MFHYTTKILISTGFKFGVPIFNLLVVLILGYYGATIYTVKDVLTRTFYKNHIITKILLHDSRGSK